VIAARGLVNPISGGRGKQSMPGKSRSWRSKILDKLKVDSFGEPPCHIVLARSCQSDSDAEDADNYDLHGTVAKGNQLKEVMQLPSARALVDNDREDDDDELYMIDDEDTPKTFRTAELPTAWRREPCSNPRPSFVTGSASVSIDVGLERSPKPLLKPLLIRRMSCCSTSASSITNTNTDCDQENLSECSFDLMHPSSPSSGCMKIRDAMDPAEPPHNDECSRVEKECFPVSSYAVNDEPTKMRMQPHRQVSFAFSDTHSVHQSEHSVVAYGEIYGEHPKSFEFDADGNKLPVFSGKASVFRFPDENEQRVAYRDRKLQARFPIRSG
jgi:hypothetical protein